jgi:hypothetical protein
VTRFGKYHGYHVLWTRQKVIGGLSRVGLLGLNESGFGIIITNQIFFVNTTP